MPEFKEYNSGGNDSTPKKGKKIKNKWFFIGLIGVVALVIIDKLRNNGSTEESGYYEIPLGYSGATFTGDGSGTQSYVDDALGTMADSTQTAIDDLFGYIKEVDKQTSSSFTDTDKYINSVIDEMSQSLTNAEKRLDDATNYIEKQNESIQYQNIISAMKSNSDKALLTSSQSEKDYLHSLNEQLGTSIGASFNDKDGYWYLNGQRLYSTDLQTSKNSGYSSVPSGSSGSSMSYQDAIRQMESNSIAYRTAGSQAEKDALYKQNQEIGKSLGLSYDSASGKWKDSSGNDAWTYDGKQDTTVKASSVSSTSNKQPAGLGVDLRNNPSLSVSSTSNKQPAGLGVDLRNNPSLSVF